MKINDLIQEEELFDYDQDEFMKDLNIFLKLVHVTGLVKGRHYRNSWCKRGELISVWGNITRKFDRLENIFKKLLKFGETDTDNESIFDTILDESVYYSLWSTLRIIKRKKEFENWINENKEIYDKFVNTLTDDEIDRWKLDQL